MPWFKVDDSFHSHPKVMATDPAALGLWVIAGSWCGANLTDGFVPDHVLSRLLPGAAKLATKLVAAGLWRRTEGGYLFHDWEAFNPSAEQVKAERMHNARRTALHRDPELVQAVRRRDGDRCRYCGVKVDWRDRRSATGATYDHVDPQGGNTLENVVVACRGCNSAKCDRSLDAVGMQLLPPRSTGHPPEPPDPDPSQNGSRYRPGYELEKTQPPDPTRPDPTRSSPAGHFEGESSGEPRAGARDGAPRKSRDDQGRPPDRCTEHRNGDADPGPCRGCRKAREHAEQFDRDTHLSHVMTIRACPHCDAEGWRVDDRRVPLTPYQRCDHRPLRSVS
jgi:hypothetical protein